MKINISAIKRVENGGLSSSNVAYLYWRIHERLYLLSYLKNVNIIISYVFSLRSSTVSNLNFPSLNITATTTTTIATTTTTTTTTNNNNNNNDDNNCLD